MMRIARDHGKFFHEVGKLKVSDLVIYEAIYRVEFQEAEKARNEAERKKNK